ncbi:hypothetical protein ACFVQ0_28145 [Streptomyces sp. NPDC057900]|uniref:hypothetical protein n=1 Tax=Streptomyces sp. NPDC057900 TaxID=3346274 RepID=UPI0036E5709B
MITFYSLTERRAARVTVLVSGALIAAGAAASVARIAVEAVSATPRRSLWPPRGRRRA